MPNDFFQEESIDLKESQNEIDPRDTYGDRFEVKSRSIPKSNRSGIFSHSSRISNSQRIFTKRHDHGNLGGRVNMKNINPVANADFVQADKTQKITIDKPDTPKKSGLDSLFLSTEVEDQKQTDNVWKEEKAPVNTASSTNSVSQNNTNKIKSAVSDRKVVVIKPTTFDAAASDISSALKQKSAVVICIKNTSSEVGKRVLDFAFGAASICGAQVSVEADRTYVFTIGSALSQREKLLCVKQGVALRV